MTIDRIEHVRRIEEASAATSVAAAAPIQWGISSGISSISSALTTPLSKIGTSLRRPFLPPPEPFYMPRLLEIEQQMHHLLNQEATSLDESSREKVSRIEAYSRKCIELLKNNAEALKSKEKWGSWQTLAEYLGYSASILLGAACIGGGLSLPTGLFFLSAGIIGLGNRIAADTTAWVSIAAYFEADRQEQILWAKNAENIGSTIALALSLAAIGSAYHVGLYELLAASGQEQLFTKIAAYLQLATGAVETASKAGEAFYNNRSLVTSAELGKLRAERSILSNEIQKDTGVIKRMFELSEEIDDVVKLAVNSSTVTE